MPTVQVILDKDTDAKLNYVANLSGKRKSEMAKDLIREGVLQKFKEMLNHPPQISQEPLVSSTIKAGRGGHKVTYIGDDPRLQNGKTYNSYVEVARIVIPDKLGLLWNRKKGTGDNAKNLLKRYAPDIYKDLRPQ
jgi:hypothetical protein